ncbi:POU domain, class 6, transcription factor 1 [Amphibalanus amphitrite]|uniref:POU domain, class 6, transcription factor 1 n=1 Tax=Amphibalanus amphitrite TaxID=1232801 RepID=A0A6A4WDF7_AMPAM|nr:POU domain, class 6, transcription factor 1 [Amphibalanus amphitrite]
MVMRTVDGSRQTGQMHERAEQETIVAQTGLMSVPTDRLPSLEGEKGRLPSVEGPAPLIGRPPSLEGAPLRGDPSVPQLVLTSGQMAPGIQGAQLIIPTAQGVTVQPIIAIPAALVAGGLAQLCLSAGHVLAATPANLQALAASAGMEPAPPSRPGPQSPAHVTRVGQALSVSMGPAYSQSAICRQKMCVQKMGNITGIPPLKKRKRRTSFTPQALEALNAHFARNTHPTGHEITHLASRLGYEREVVRIWFCNKRQALKSTVRLVTGRTGRGSPPGAGREEPRRPLTEPGQPRSPGS